jgi:hypothetical protein
MTISTFTKEHLETLRRGSFPKLRVGKDKVTSDKTPPKSPRPYNCVAWAAHDDTIWWEYDPEEIAGFKTYWPSGLTEDGSVESWVKMFESEFNYKKATNGRYERGFEKIAIYGMDKKATHVARQVGKNRWISKLGFNYDIEHRTLECLCTHSDNGYGDVVQFLKRRV